MLRPEMNLPERSEFSSQALLLIRFQILYFSQIPEWNKDPASRISVPFYPGNSEFFPVFLNSSSFRQIRISLLILRKEHLNPGSFPGRAVHADFRSMQQCAVLNNRKSQACAAALFGMAFIYRVDKSHAAVRRA